MKYYLVSTEDQDKIGVTPDLRTAKRLAREEFHCRYERADLSFEEGYDEINSQKYWMGDCLDGKLPIVIIEEVEFYDRGSRFPFESAEQVRASQA